MFVKSMMAWKKFPTTQYHLSHIHANTNYIDSADGTLSIMDVRSKKAGPYAQSEDQEDELLSVVAIKR